MALSEILKEIRRQLGITQEQLAHDLSISFSTISRWENDHTSPSRLAKIRLLEYCSDHDIAKDIITQLKES
ncbi:MAG: helix-turn-helix transcriptional regulator [Candidatus Pelethousia sp.]|jgi:transcriptional regulator with XRE-family HTH domain|nr:helix-turn-helix transcriptional regulator [Candidatus Pelethousia sp.]